MNIDLGIILTAWVQSVFVVQERKIMSITSCTAPSLQLSAKISLVKSRMSDMMLLAWTQRIFVICCYIGTYMKVPLQTESF